MTEKRKDSHSTLPIIISFFIMTLFLLPALAFGVCTDSDSDGYGEFGDALCPNGTAIDCDDGDDTINPGATETWYDGVDQDCDLWNDYDQDMDSYIHSSYTGEEDASIIFLDELFESGLPSGWSVIDNAETGAVWLFDDPGSAEAEN